MVISGCTEIVSVLAFVLVSVLVTVFCSNRVDSEGWATCKFSSSSFTMGTGLDSVGTLGALPSTLTRRGPELEDPESSRSNMCLGFLSRSSNTLRNEVLGAVLTFAVFWGLKVDNVGVCTGGGGAGVCGGESELETEEILMGFGGGFF